MIVEELIGRLSLQTKGVKDARDAVKVLADLRKGLKSLAGSARGNFDGPAKMAKGFREARREAERMAAVQARAGNSAGLQRQLSTMQRLKTAYVDTAKAAAQLAKRPQSAGRSWIQDEIRSLRDYQKLQREIDKGAARRGMRRNEFGRQQGPYQYGGRQERGGRMEGLRNPVAGSVDVRGLLDKGFDSATTIPQVQAQMRMRKESEADIDRATKLAEKLSGDVKQFTSAEHLQGIYQSLAVFGDMDSALKAAPGLARANALIEGLSDQFTRLKPFKGGTATKDFARVFDLMGVTTDQKKQDALSESMIKVLEQSSGDITPSDILIALKYAKSARYGFNADFLQNYLSGIIGDAKVKSGGASGAGVGLMSAFNNFHDLGGPAWTLEGMNRYGLIKDPSKLHYNKKGKISGKGTAELVNKAGYRENPQRWFVETMLPAIEKLDGKLTGDDQTDAGKILAAVGQMAMNRNAKDQATSAILQKDERERDANLTRKMPGISALAELDKAPVSTLQQFTAGVTELFAALAAPAVQPALATMKALGDAARSIANFQRENPDAAPVVSGTVGAVGGAGAAGAAVVGKRMLGRLLGLGGGKTPGGGAPPPTTPVEPPSPTTGGARIVGGPQASAGDVIARGIARGAAAAAFPITAGMTKGDQNAFLKRWYEQQGAPSVKAKDGSTGPAASLPNTGAVEARLSEIQAVTDKGAEKIKEAMTIDGKLTLDTAAIDAAMAKLAKLKAEMASVGSVSVGGVGGASIAKGSNTFTSPGATAP